MYNMRVCMAILIVIALCAVSARADTIHLKNGNKVDGIILDSRDGDLTVKLDIGMVMTFSKAEIASVERSDAEETEALEQSWKEKNAQTEEDTGEKRTGSKEASRAKKKGPSKINWVKSFSRGMSQAKSSGKPAMIDFYTDWCGWCTKLDNVTYKDKEVLLLSTEFVCIKIDADDHSDLVKRYAIRGYPTILFLGPDGKEIGRIPGFLPAKPFGQMMKKFLK